MSRVAVVQIVDTLAMGGTERVAVNLANLLPKDVYDVTLCTTRTDGPLAGTIGPGVRRLNLHRRHTADLSALRRLVRFNQQHGVSIVHAHSTSVFLAAAAAAFPPRPAVVWHDHFGSSGIRTRSPMLYRLVARRLSAVVAVNQYLRDWAVDTLGVPPDRASYLPNFVMLPPAVEERMTLPGVAGFRLVCVANFRPQKDHLGLVHAMAGVVDVEPRAHLFLIGARRDGIYLEQVGREIAARGLERHITILGERQDATRIVRSCDVGVLSSRSEGLPLAVLEYGAAGVAVVATDVGQVSEVLADGAAGVIVPAGSPDSMRDGILDLLASAERRRALAAKLRRRVSTVYSADSAIRHLCSIYESVRTSITRAA